MKRRVNISFRPDQAIRGRRKQAGHKLDHASHENEKNDIIHGVNERDDILGFGERKEGKTLSSWA